MIICPNCRQRELSGAIFCSHCGAQLVDGNATSRTVPADGKQPQGTRGDPPGKAPCQAGGRCRISLKILESGQVLTLANLEEYSLGRSTEGQPIIPDVDLSQFDAYANGVSRLHAVLKLADDAILLMDLGSANGTFVNSERLKPYIDVPVAHGDTLRLGRLKVQLLVE